MLENRKGKDTRLQIFKILRLYNDNKKTECNSYTGSAAIIITISDRMSSLSGSETS